LRLWWTGSKLKFQWRHGILCLRLAILAKKMEILPLSLLLADPMASTMLPDIALIARHAVGTVVEVLTMHTAHGAIKVPRIVLLLQVLKILLPFLHIRLELTLRNARTFSIGVFTFSLEPFKQFFFFLQALFLQDTFGLSFS
jgi:hypothetical protein